MNTTESGGGGDPGVNGDTFSATLKQSFIQFYILDSVIIVISSVLVALLLWTRLVTLKSRLLLYHKLILVVYVFMVAGLGTDIYRAYISDRTQTLFGQVMVELDQMKQYQIGLQLLDCGIQIAKISYVAPMFYYTTMWLTKGALLAVTFDLRMNLSNGLKYALFVSMAYVAASWLVVMFSQAFWCTPASNWDVEKICSPFLEKAYLYLTFALTLSTDMIVMVLMVTVILKLQISRRERLAFLFVVIIGTVSIVATIIRFSMVLSIYNQAQQQGGIVTKDGNAISTWSTIEMFTAFLAGTLPSLRVFFRKALKSTVDSFTYPKNSGDSSSGKRSQTSYNNVSLNPYKPSDPDLSGSTQRINVTQQITVQDMELGHAQPPYGNAAQYYPQKESMDLSRHYRHHHHHHVPPQQAHQMHQHQSGMQFQTQHIPK